MLNIKGILKFIWKNQLIMGVIVFLLTEYILSPLISYYLPKPNVVSNVAVYKYADITQIPSVKMKNLNLLYYLGYNSSLFLVNSDDLKFISKNIGIGQYTNFDFNECQNCSYYAFGLKNEGNGKANKVEINIKSTSEPNIPQDSIVNSSKITVECPRTYYSGYECDITIENMDTDGKDAFALVFNEPSDINVISCMADDKYECQPPNFVKILAQNINPTIGGLIMNGNILLFPTLENYKSNTLYYFNPTDSTWGPIPPIE
jgi:hypothetical protein